MKVYLFIVLNASLRISRGLTIADLYGDGIFPTVVFAQFELSSAVVSVTPVT